MRCRLALAVPPAIRRSWCLIMPVSVFVLLGFGAPPAAGADEAALFGRWERSFSAEGQTEKTARLVVELTAPGGESRTVDGFWDGGSTWRVRFLADEEGAWRYRTRSVPPGVAGLDGLDGSFVCRRGEAKTELTAHGPVRISDDGHYLVHADGTPFFWLVDTAWNGALLSQEDEWRRFIDDRLAKRFTGVKFVCTDWRTAYENAEGQRAYSGSDEITIHPEFFRRIDARIDALNDRGLLAVPVLLWTLGRPEHSPGQLPEAQAVRLARYMIARWQGNHVIWILPGDGNYFGANAERWKRIGRAVYDRPGHAPAMLHPQGMQWPFDAFLDEKWVSIFGYQSGHGDDANTLRWIYAGPPAQKWTLAPHRPVINIEPPYEDHIAYQSRQRHTDSTVRRAAWWSVLNAPTAGVSYGAHGVWSWERKPGEPLNHGGTGVARPWHEAMVLPGSAQMGHLAALMTSLVFWRLRPDPQLVGRADDDGAAAVRLGTRSHLVYTRDAAGPARFYLDGKPIAERTVAGDMANWDRGFRVALANELTGERPWRGTLHRVGVYSRALPADEIARNTEKGRNTSTDALLALYTFAEGRGTTVADTSGTGRPLDLSIGEAGAVRWVEGGGLRVERPVTIASPAAAEKITDAVRTSRAISIEAWVEPASAAQAGPARIVTLSRDTGERNFTLGQDGAAYEVRLRTSQTSPNGEPALATATAAGAGAAAHVAAARTEGGDTAVIYIPVGAEVRIDAGRLAPGVAAEWFDPRTGRRTPAAPREGAAYRTPDEKDWVLVFTRR